jgi:hypothetical protein
MTDSENAALTSARDGIVRAFEAATCVQPPGPPDVIDEWTSFEVTKHEVGVRYKGTWYCIEFCEFPDGGFGNGSIRDVGPGGKAHGSPVRLTSDQIEAIADGIDRRTSAG